MTNNKEQHIKALMVKYLDDSLSEAERTEFFLLVDTEPAVIARCIEQMPVPEQIVTPLLTQDDQALIREAIFSLSKKESPFFETEREYVSIPVVPSPVRRAPFYRRWWAAASVLLLLGIGAYLWHQDSSRPQALTNTYNQLPTDIEPGREGAILTLADGTEVVLDSLGNGLIAMQGGTQVVLQGGQLAYDPTGATAVGDMVYNTMSTPKGRQFNLLLPDGTRVWLNAASSLRYPTSFSGATRRVEITGEAYFEVAKDKAKPFLVKIQDRAEIEVLGTSFNVNAYENEATINATLIEGSMRVAAFPALVLGNRPATKAQAGTKSDQSVILKAGQQAQIAASVFSDRQPSSSQPIKVVNDTDIEKVMAWKNGLFSFQDASLEEVMRQLARWYDIEVVYENGVPDISFGGKMSRDVTLGGVLNLLAGSQLRFRMEEGKRLVVLP